MSRQARLVSLVLLLGALASGCTKRLLITIESQTQIEADTLEVAVSNAARTTQVTLARGASLQLPPERDFSLDLDRAVQGEVAVAVHALRNGQQVAEGTGGVLLGSGRQTRLRITLQPDDGTSPRLALLAGKLGGAGSLDGPTAQARFNFPAGIAADRSRNLLYVADMGGNDTIRRVDLASGQVSTLVGFPGYSGSSDGVGPAARVSSPIDVAFDALNNRLYVADSLNATIRSIDVATATVSTLAGAPGERGAIDAPLADARFNSPQALALDDTSSTLYVADTENHNIRVIDLAAGIVGTLAGVAGQADCVDEVGTSARFNHPQDLALRGGRLYVADRDNHVVRMIDLATRQVTILAGSCGQAACTDATGTDARFATPVSVELDDSGAMLFVAEQGNQTLRSITLATRAVRPLAGACGQAGSVDGTGTEARFFTPRGLAWGGADTLWAADAGNSLIRRLTPSTRAVSILTGSRSNPGRDDGTGAAARFFLPREMTIDGQGNLVVADRPNQTIRRISLATGLTTTWVGMAGQPGSADGIGAAARFRGPTVVTYDGSGVIYVADTVNNTIRRILVATGEVSTLAGKAGETRSDDGIGAAAGFFQPNGLAYDGAGVLYVADTFNNTIRRIRVATGEVTTLAGAVGPPDCVDGIGTAARFRFPATLAYDGQGSLYVSSGCHAIHRITVSTGEVTTVAGVRARGYDDGIGLAARFNEPLGIALDQSGHLYVADSLNNAIRCVTLSTGQVRTVLGKAGPGAVITGPLAQSLLYRPFGLESISPGVLAISVSSDNAILITRGLGCGP